MKQKFANNENENKYIRTYQAKGYTAEFIVNKNKLVDISDLKEFTAQEVYIVAKYLFESIHNPEYIVTLYIIKTTNRSKGTFLFKNDTAQDSEVLNFFNDIPEGNISNNQNLL